MDAFQIALTDLHVNGATKLVTRNVTKLFKKFNAIIKVYYVTAKSSPKYRPLILRIASLFYSHKLFL